MSMHKMFKIKFYQIIHNFCCMNLKLINKNKKAIEPNEVPVEVSKTLGNFGQVIRCWLMQVS